MRMRKSLQKKLQRLLRNLFPIICSENGDWLITLQVFLFSMQLLNA